MSDMRIYTHALMKLMAIMVMLFAMANHAHADRTKDAADMVETLIFEIQDIAANVGSDGDIYAQTDDIINRYFKYETLASFTIGPYWRKATDTQKQRFLKTFRTVLVEQAAFNFDYFRTLEYQFQSSEKKGNTGLLSMALFMTQPDNIPMRLYPGGLVINPDSSYISLISALKTYPCFSPRRMKIWP